jgi:hypothetical protein
MRLWKRTREDTGQDMSTASAVRPDTVPAVQSDMDKDLWWVQILLNVGRPVVAVFVLVMCAPGEHYLAQEAGWTPTLAWGMPGTLTAYAGIAAVVATKRPKDAPGRKTAVWGAVLSIALAMAAQPIAHLYGRPGLSTRQIGLIIAVSCIPALVFGHLLHMAASAVRVRVSSPVVRDITPDLSGLDAAVRDAEDKVSGTRTFQMDTRTREEILSDWTAARDNRTTSVSPDMSVDTSTWTPEADTDMSDLDTTMSGWTAREVSGQTTPVRDTDISELSWKQAVVQINRPGVPAVVRAVLAADKAATDKDIREAVRVQLGPDIPQNTIYKGIARTRKTMDIPAIKEA